MPDFELLTSEARAVLPEIYSRSDLVYNSSRSALWTTAIALDKPELLKVASQDKVHEPYREPLIKGMRACRQRLEKAGAIAVYLSGAGTTLAAISLDDATTENCKKAMEPYVGGGKVHILSPSNGYQYLS
ncbi:MAG: hypothetical protein R2880_19060 [Deinococcales bacterium]